MSASSTHSFDGVLLDANLITLDGDAGYGVIEQGVLAWRDGLFDFVGTRADWEHRGNADDRPTQHAEGQWVTPGLVDCHTHTFSPGIAPASSSSACKA